MSLQSKFNETLVWLLLKLAINHPEIGDNVVELSALVKKMKEKEE